MLQVTVPTILGRGAQILGWGLTLCPGATPLPQGQPQSPGGNPFALGAIPKPLAQTQSPEATNAIWYKCELCTYGTPPLARILEFGGISTHAFPRGSSQPLLLAQTPSTPGLRPGIRPRQKRLGRILGRGHGVEQFSATATACSTQAKTPESSRNLLWRDSARPTGHA